MRNGIWLLLGAVILMCALATLAAAQGTADMVGRVADSSGGVLPGVTVTARHLATNLTRTTVTSETGDYAFTALPIGEYEVKTELSGFRTETSRITLATGDRARVGITSTGLSLRQAGHWRTLSMPPASLGFRT